MGDELEKRSLFMLNPNELEQLYQEFVSNLSDWAHDGIIPVDLHLLHEMGLLDQSLENTDSSDLTQFFHVIESPDKVTLFNEQFAIWIIPKMEQETPITYVLIALTTQGKTQLEIVFTTTGIYNTPKYVLKVLQHFLIDMIETEATLTAMEQEES